LTVGVLSTLAPLALAGAVHLHILIARHTPAPAAPFPARTEVMPPHPGDRTEVSRPHPEPTEPTELPGLPEPQAETDDPEQAPQPDTTDGPRYGRPPGAEMDVLLDIARKAIDAHGKCSRTVVRDAIHEAKLPIGESRLTELMKLLRAETDRPADQGHTT
ncbi:hypothetical protein ACFC0M_37010, partial [Streptomyces sp. NPDC056149]